MNWYRVTSIAALLLFLTAAALYSFARGSQPIPRQGRKPAELRPDVGEYSLRTRGYPEVTPLARAVEEFNEHAKRTEVGKTQPPLTVEEVLAAVRNWSPKEDPIEPKMFAALQEAARAGMLPKGSYLSFSSGSVSRNGYDIDAWNIYLQVGLNQHPADLVGVPSYGVLVRRQYIASRPEEFLKRQSK